MVCDFLAGLMLIVVVRPSLVRSTPALFNQYRPLSTESIPANEAESIIAAQRKHRPISPHLSIYQPQITWYLSMFNRITGAILSGGCSSAVKLT
jgi:succinate dehydrogenase (ubiquinone) cytochrome b560 subunit